MSQSCDNGQILSTSSESSLCFTESRGGHLNPQRSISLNQSAAHVGLVKEEKVKLSHLISPKEFYVTIVSDPDKLKDMRCKIDNWACNIYQHPPSPDAVANDPHVIAFSSNHNQWCRAKLRPMNNNNYRGSRKDLYSSPVNVFRKSSVEVDLMDYGGVEKVPYSNLRHKCDEIFDQSVYPPLALKCCLHTIVPFNGKGWTERANDLIYEFCEDKDVILRVKEPDCGLYYCDLVFYPPQGAMVSLREYLVHMKEAKYWFGGGEDLEISPTQGYTNLPNLEIGKQYHVRITDIRNPDLFYVNLLKKEKVINDFHANLEMYFNLPDNQSDHFEPTKGSPCIIHQDNKFYRGLILEILSGKAVKAELVDFGRVRRVAFKDLRQIGRDHFILPLQAIRCRLGEIAPISGFKWSKEATEVFRREVFGNKEFCQFIICVNGFDQSGKTLSILKKVTRNQLFINTVLVDLGVARPLLQEQIMHHTDDSEIQVLSEYSSSTLKFDESVLTELKTYDVCGYNILKEIVERNVQANCSKVESYVKVTVSHWQSPNAFYVQIFTPEVLSYFKEYENRLIKEHIEIIKQEPIGNLKPLKTGIVCLFNHYRVNHDSWYRGDVLERLDSSEDMIDELTTQYNIRSKDYGFTVTVSRKDVRKLPKFSDFLKDDDFCIKCGLKNIKPAGGGDWTSSALDEFESLVKKYKQFLYLSVDSKLPDDKPEVLDVELYGQETKIARALEPSVIKNYNIATALILRGYAVPIDDTSFSDDDEDIQVIDDGDEDKFMHQPFSYKSDSIISHLRDGIKNIDEKIAKQVLFYREAVRPYCESFMVRITHVDDDFKVWWRVIEEGTIAPIKVINKRINQVLRERDQLTPLIGEAFVGRAITAYFSYDRSWNRAEILSEEDDGRKLVVQFVDYGNINTISRDQASSDVFHLEIPKLSMCGYLTQLSPKSVTLQIKESIVDELYKLLVDKECLVFWENYKSKTDMRISIILADNRDVREELLTTGLVKRNYNDIKDNPSDITDLLEIIDHSHYITTDPEFQLNECYPIVSSGPVIYNYVFFQTLPLDSPKNAQEKQINVRHKIFLEKLELMRDNVHTFLEADDFTVGDACCAKFSDGAWYRGLVIEVLFPKEVYKVLYVDYGNTEEIEMNSLKILPLEYVNTFPIHVYPGKLYNTYPAQDKTPYGILKKRMQRVLDNHPDSLVCRIKSDKRPWEVEIYICDVNDRRLPVRNVFQSLYESRELLCRDETDIDDGEADDGFGDVDADDDDGDNTNNSNNHDNDKDEDSNDILIE